VAVNVEELFEDVQDLGHLSENKGTVAAGLKISKESCETLEFAAVILQEAFVRESNRLADTGLVERVPLANHSRRSYKLYTTVR
jgi:hypothetical protein